MTTPKPFRFAVSVYKVTSKGEWANTARKIEQLGYSTLVVSDHLLVIEQLAPISALLAAADATTTLRIGSYVFNNDFRHPVMLAKEAATLDVLSGGRFEFGLGAGHTRAEYEQCGITYDPAPIRIRRLGEAIQIVKGLLAEEPASFSGEFYTINNLKGFPKPLQQPSLPLLIGGGGKQVLSLAAREASIISLIPKALLDGSNLDITDMTPEATMQKINWIRQAAGNRFGDIELNIRVFGAYICSVCDKIISRISKEIRVREDEVQNTPHFLIGTVDQVVEKLQKMRELYGISYITISERDVEAFAPVVTRLAGK